MSVNRIRHGDAILAGVLTALGSVLMFINTAGIEASRVDSTSWLVYPVFAAATIPIAFRRVNLPAVFAVTPLALGVHVLAFGWMVRCGAGLPLAIALAYAAGRLCPLSRSVAGLVGASAVAALVLVKDSAAGLEAMTLAVPLAVAACGVGVLVQRRFAAPREVLSDRVAVRA